jgi:hypothetical protein
VREVEGKKDKRYPDDTETGTNIAVDAVLVGEGSVRLLQIPGIEDSVLPAIQ